MKHETFSSDSNNPRKRRAFAHATRDQALISGEPADKLSSIDAAISASGTSKGRNLGKQAINAFRKMSGTELDPDPIKLREVHQHATFTTEPTAHAMSVVAKIEGRKHGVFVSAYKPEGIEEYVGAFRKIDAHEVRNKKGLIEYGINGKTQPADIPRSEEMIQNGATYHLNKASEVAEVTAAISTENFHRTVDAIVKPHEV